MTTIKNRTKLQSKWDWRLPVTSLRQRWHAWRHETERVQEFEENRRRLEKMSPHLLADIGVDMNALPGNRQTTKKAPGINRRP